MQQTHTLSVMPHLIKWLPKNRHSSRKLLGFDLDHTIIRPHKGKFSRTSDDWLFMKYGDSDALTKLSNELKSSPDMQVILFSNQGGVVSEPRTSKSCIKLVDKLDKILKHICEFDADLCDRVWIYCATKLPASLSKNKRTESKNRIVKKTALVKKVSTDINVTPQLFEQMRKPNNGMVEEFSKDFGLEMDSLNWVFYCGDAAGRPSDFSDSDKQFALKQNIPFKLPEEYFT